MILFPDRAQRNYNYLEIISKYNAFVEQFGEDAEINDKQFETFKRELGSSLIGIDSVETILASLVSDDEGKNPSLDLFVDNGDNNYSLYKKSKIMPVASREEVLIVFSMLQNNDFDLTLTSEQKDKIYQNINTYFNNLSEQPFNLYDYIDNKGQSLCADILSEIKDFYTELKSAIKNKQFVRIRYYYNDITEQHCIQPIGFVYSQLDLRLRVKAFVESGKLLTFYLSNIKEINTMNDAPFERFEAKEPVMKELVFSFENINNRAERVAALFSDYRKTVKYNRKNNLLTYHVFYPDNLTENNRVFFRLRSLGKGMKIESEEKRRIKDDAIKALGNYKKWFKNQK